MPTLLAACAALAGIAAPPAAQAQLRFTDVTSVAFRDASGDPIALIHDSRGFVLEGGAEVPNFFGPGVAWADVNGDDWLDLMVGNGSMDNRTGGPKPNYLLLNNGDGTFTDVSQAWGVAVSRGANGLVFADAENDGRLDLAVMNYFAEPQYYVGGDGGMSESAQFFGLSPLLASEQGDILPESMGGAFGDYDRDGFVDLYIANYLDQPDLLLRSLRGSYWARSDRLPNVTQEFGFQPVFFDFDNDGDQDLYVTNDFGPNYLFENQGEAAGWAFVERADQYKVAGGRTSAEPYSMDMGVAVGDYDNDGDFDLYTTIYNGNALYESLGPQVGGLWRFRNRAEAAGVKFGLNCWGVDFCDLDHDTDLDLIFASGFIDGYTRSQPTGIPNKVYLNNGAPDWTFTDVSTQVAFADTNMGRGLATADYDRDGDLDVAITNNSFHDPLPGAPDAVLYEGRAMLYRNDLRGGGRSLVLRVQGGGEHQPGLGCNRCGIGARVTLTAGGVTQMREVIAGGSYLSMNSLEVEFGLGDATAIDQLQVRWPCGSIEAFTGAQPDRSYTLVEGQGVAAPPPIVIESFSATALDDQGEVLLEWRVSGNAPELDGLAVELQRNVAPPASDPLVYLPLELPLDGGVAVGSATDAGAAPNVTYSYRLLLRRQGAVVAASPALRASLGDTGDPPRPRPERAVLGQNFPNPFNPGTTIMFELPYAAPARLSIHDARGRLVRVLVDEVQDAGPHQVVWDGRDDLGLAVAGGAYFYALRTPDGTSTRRLVLIR